MYALLRLSRWLEVFSRFIAGIALVSLLGVTVVDVALRFLYRLSDGALSLSVVGSVELVSYLMLFALLAAMAANVEKSQVVVEAFSHGLRDSLKARIAGVYLLGFVVLGLVLAFGLWDAAASAAAHGETTQDLRLPMAPIYYIASGLCVLLGIRCLLHAVLGALFAHQVESVE